MSPRSRRRCRGWRKSIPCLTANTAFRWPVLVNAATWWHSSGLGIEPLPFDHPMLILFSQNYGAPKGDRPHCHGGIPCRAPGAPRADLGPARGDRLFFPTTTAWMLSMRQVATLERGADHHIRWEPRVAGPERYFAIALTAARPFGARSRAIAGVAEGGPGTSADFRTSARCVRSARQAHRCRPKAIAGSTSNPFSSALSNGTGGTKVCTGTSLRHLPDAPVWAGEMSARSLGVAASAFDSQGNAVVNELGELVITKPMPSMPIGFWNDSGGIRYHTTYFDLYPGVWRQGDWARFTERGTSVVTGRSDATLNRGGVRLGSGDFYAVLEEMPEVTEAIIVHLEDPAGRIGPAPAVRRAARRPRIRR